MQQGFGRGLICVCCWMCIGVAGKMDGVGGDVILVIGYVSTGGVVDRGLYGGCQ